jgi:CRP-like cAMP-binding protein
MASVLPPDLPLLLALDAALEVPGFFAAFPKETLGTFLPSLSFRRYTDGETVVNEGDPGGEFFVLLQGSVLVRKQRPGGPDRIVATLAEGDTFGEVALMAATRRTASIVANEPLILTTMSTRDFQKVLEREPELGDRLEKQAKSRLTESPE